VRQIYPAAGPELEVVASVQGGDLPPAVAALAALYRGDTAAQDRPWLQANMVSSTDGAAWLAGRTGGLSGSADRMVFAVLRSLADVILVGAATARDERYKPVQTTEVWPQLRAGRPATPAIAVVSAGLALDPRSPLLAKAPPDARTIVLTTSSAPAGKREAAGSAGAEVVDAGRNRVAPGAALAALAERGYRHVLTEGGPTLLGQFAAAGLVDELCLTVSPLLAGGTAGRIVRDMADETAGPAALRLVHVLADDGYLLCRYLRAG
jgi:riboflavin biosynthesis pyrimidine reductase